MCWLGGQAPSSNGDVKCTSAGQVWLARYMSQGALLLEVMETEGVAVHHNGGAQMHAGKYNKGASCPSLEKSGRQQQVGDLATARRRVTTWRSSPNYHADVC